MRTFIVFLIATLSACSVGVSTAIEAARPAPGPGFLRGQVQNDRGFHLSGLSVLAISQERGGSRTGLTDDNGIFVINDLQPGSYCLVILRGSSPVAERSLEFRSATARDIHLIVPTIFGDSPSERDRPIVDRALLSTTTE